MASPFRGGDASRILRNSCATTASLASSLMPNASMAASAKQASASSLRQERRIYTYTSLGEPISGSTTSSPAEPWQAEHNIDVQRVTQQALIYELTQQSSSTLERVVPWFLANMPSSYFKQVPERMRLDHIKAMAAVFSSSPSGAQSNLHLNLKSTIPDGRIVWTFIRPGTKPGTLLSMVEEQKHLDMSGAAAAAVSSGDLTIEDGAGDKLPLTRLLVFSSKDDAVSLNMFVYGHKTFDTSAHPETVRLTLPPSTREESYQSILSFAKNEVQAGRWQGAPHFLPPSPLFEADALREYMESKCSDNYVQIGQKVPARFLRQRLMVEEVSGTEGCAVHMEKAASASSISALVDEDVNMDGNISSSDYFWIDVAVANSLPQIALEHTCRLLYMHQLDVSRARLDIIDDGDNGSITLLRLLVRPGSKASLEEISSWNGRAMDKSMEDATIAAAAAADADDNTDEAQQQELQKQQVQQKYIFPLLAQELKRAKWLDPATIDLVFNSHMKSSKTVVGVIQGEIITAMASLMHPIMAQQEGGDALLYTKSNILETLSQPRILPWAVKIADLFLDRFDPENPLRDDDDLERRMDAIKQDISKNVEQTLAVELLGKMMDIVKHTLKTNVYMQDRYGLGLRLDPNIMMQGKTSQQQQQQKPKHDEIPYGIFFVHGRRFNGYHVRFRDISRGGMRLVTPTSSEQLALESARQFEECYGLAYAQQLKNKDIPEGGSKAVCLIDTVDLMASSTSSPSMDAEQTKNFAIRKSVKAFTDTILDLVVSTDETKKNIVDYWGRPEVLYLGPDEQVIPDDINWIIGRAAKRGYNTPAAFMSSKPKAGINHKEFGVTSEGVNVYLDVALRETLQIDPTKDSFTIKMTGGPDGDVGGNEIKILVREYGSNCKIVGIADHSGCAEDPDGLDHDELLRLVNASLPIAEFNGSKLGKRGAVHDVSTDEGVKARNSMHNRLVADAFVPCGGRPNTIDKTNYQRFLLPDGVTPSSRLIVEGANLFVTAEARQSLWQEAGVTIVKDSSANKGGVITSSYEICAAMLLTDENDFFAKKDQIVSEVLAKLRGLAGLEARLLFREQKNAYSDKSLPEVSQIISNSINKATDALTTALATLSEEDRDQLLPLFRAHLPPTLADMAFEHVHERVPEQYIQNAIASCLASKLVYKEGTKFIDNNQPHKLAEIALEYVKKEKEIATLMHAIEETDMPDEEKQRVLKLLDAGGARTALSLL